MGFPSKQVTAYFALLKLLSVFAGSWREAIVLRKCNVTRESFIQENNHILKGMSIALSKIYR